jgi:transposase
LLLAHVLFAKYGLHLPLNRQSKADALEGIALDVSTLVDWVGATAATLMQLVVLIRAHVLAAGRILRSQVSGLSRFPLTAVTSSARTL